MRLLAHTDDRLVCRDRLLWVAKGFVLQADELLNARRQQVIEAAFADGRACRPSASASLLQASRARALPRS